MEQALLLGLERARFLSFPSSRALYPSLLPSLPSSNLPPSFLPSTTGLLLSSPSTAPVPDENKNRNQSGHLRATWKGSCTWTETGVFLFVFARVKGCQGEVSFLFISFP